MNQALGVNSASANLEKQLNKLRLDEASSKKAITNIEAMNQALNNIKNNDDDDKS